MGAYYNEIDPYAAQWLRNLIAAGHIAAGDVDERSIEDVKADDLRGYEQAHFFAGIGGWSYALRLAGWDDARPVWTGSCPCQPFSAAGRNAGLLDTRHVWPTFHRLIAECSPTVIFGEQVASKDGRYWLAGVRTELELCGYAVGAANLCAASVGAPHVRQRFFWTAALVHTDCERLEGLHEASRGIDLQSTPKDVRRHWQAEPEMDRVANGLPNCVGRLRAYGNAIVPQVAAEFIKATL